MILENHGLSLNSMGIIPVTPTSVSFYHLRLLIYLGMNGGQVGFECPEMNLDELQDQKLLKTKNTDSLELGSMKYSPSWQLLFSNLDYLWPASANTDIDLVIKDLFI